MSARRSVASRQRNLELRIRAFCWQRNAHAIEVWRRAAANNDLASSATAKLVALSEPTLPIAHIIANRKKLESTRTPAKVPTPLAWVAATSLALEPGKLVLEGC